MTTRCTIEAASDEIDPRFGQTMRKALDLYRAEVLHEAAEEIREANSRVPVSDAYYVGTGMSDAADLIDPEETS